MMIYVARHCDNVRSLNCQADLYTVIFVRKHE